jgi:hypothetical protein
LAIEFVSQLENSVEIAGDKVKVLKPEVVKKYARKLADKAVVAMSTKE